MQYCKYIFYLFVVMGLFNPVYSYSSVADYPNIAQVKVSGDRYVAMIKEVTAEPYSVIEWVPEGAFVVMDSDNVIEEGKIGKIPVNWSKVTYKKNDGFILKHLLLQYEKNKPDETYIAAAARIIPLGNRYINLRGNSVRGADFIGCVPEGEIVPIVSPLITNKIGGNIVGEWYEIEYGGIKGFVPKTLVKIYFLDPDKFPEVETEESGSDNNHLVSTDKQTDPVSGGEDGNSIVFVDGDIFKKDKFFDQDNLDDLLNGFEMKCNALARIFQVGSRYVINEDFNSLNIDFDSACFNSSRSLNKIYEINGIQRRIISLLGEESELYNSFLYLLNNKFEYREGDILLLCDDEESDVKLIKVMDISSKNKMSYSIINKKDDDKEETLTLEGGFGTILPKIERACRLQ